MGLELVESRTTGQDISFRCFVFTSFPTTFPRDRISNVSVNGITMPVCETVKLDPAPYSGTLSPSTITDTVRRLFLG